MATVGVKWIATAVVWMTTVRHVLSVTPLHGIYERIEDETVEMVYQLPPDTLGLKGVLAVFHGCSHRATDWFPVSDSCKACIGLPVERTIAQGALDRGFAVLAISSQNKEHKCWLPHGDILPVSKAIRHFYAFLKKSTNVGSKRRELFSSTETMLGKGVSATQMMSPPLFLLGASSGGSFVASFAAESRNLSLHVSAICVQISAIRQTNHVHVPPTLFVHMTSDGHTSRAVGRIIEQLNKRSVGGVMVAAQHLCQSKAITPSYFHDHGQALSVVDSATLVAALTAAGIIDAATGKLKDDPRMTDWRQTASKALPHVVLSRDNLKPDESAVSELLNLAWAAHEITDEFLPETFQWFLDHSG